MERKNRMANKCKIKIEKVNGGRQAFTTLRALFRRSKNYYSAPCTWATVEYEIHVSQAFTINFNNFRSRIVKYQN